MTTFPFKPGEVIWWSQGSGPYDLTMTVQVLEVDLENGFRGKILESNQEYETDYDISASRRVGEIHDFAGNDGWKRVNGIERAALRLK